MSLPASEKFFSFTTKLPAGMELRGDKTTLGETYRRTSTFGLSGHRGVRPTGFELHGSGSEAAFEATSGVTGAAFWPPPPVNCLTASWIPTKMAMFFPIDQASHPPAAASGAGAAAAADSAAVGSSFLAGAGAGVDFFFRAACIKMLASDREYT